jgi:hypothetical protein
MSIPAIIRIPAEFIIAELCSESLHANSSMMLGLSRQFMNIPADLWNIPPNWSRHFGESMLKYITVCS